ncbi:MAG: GntR family transcriptional regulator [Hyphomicrobiaceae bacterium]
MKGADKAYEFLRTEIFSGVRRSGERLSEVGLAAQLGLSRTPVRAALHRLKADGLIHWEAHRSAVVRQWSRRDARQILEVRSLLESAAAGKAAERARPEDCEGLEALCEEMEALARRPVPSPEITVLNRRFHVELLRLAGNDRLQEIAAELMDLGLLIQIYTAASVADVERSLRHHREILTAVRAGNSAWAEAIMKAHIQAASTLYAEAETPN